VTGVPGEAAVERRLEIEDSGFFVDVLREGYPWSTSYSRDHDLGLRRSQSDHWLLDPADRERLHDGLAAVLATYGNQVEQVYCAFR